MRSVDLLLIKELTERVAILEHIVAHYSLHIHEGHELLPEIILAVEKKYREKYNILDNEIYTVVMNEFLEMNNAK